MEILTIAALALVTYAFGSLRVLRQYERGVTFLLGRYWATKGPGLVFVPAILTRMERVSLRIVLYMRVKNPELAIIEIEKYQIATSQLAQTTLRSVLGEVQLDELLADRDKINAILKNIVDERTEPWGIEVSAVEVKDVDLPQEMKRAMARQAEAERERRAKVIAAEGEFQASGRLAEAAGVISQQPSALQLRYLQTLAEIATENNSTMLFPIPIDLLTPFMEMAKAFAKGEKQLPSSTGTPLPKEEGARKRERA